MNYLIRISICLALIFTGCRSTKRTTASAEDLASAKIIDTHYKTHLDFETLAARLKVRYKDEKTAQSVSVSLRMEKDKTIWMSASILGISLAKVLITPDRVQYYEKINGTYFDGDFKLLSKLLGTPIDFEQAQSLFLGQPIYDLRTGNFNASGGGRNYLVVPKKQQTLFNLFFYLNPGQFTMNQQRITQTGKDRELTVSYSDFEVRQKGILPENISIRAKEAENSTEIDIEYRSLDLDQEVGFPFEIPSGYKEIEL